MDRTYEKYGDYSDNDFEYESDEYDGYERKYYGNATSHPLPDVSRILLDKFDSEYSQVLQIFQRTASTKKFTLTATRIEKVINMELLLKFEEKKNYYKEMYGHVRMVKVFHGTKSSNIPSILKNNFRVQLHGQSVGHRFGAGVSFSAFANYASHYCDKTDSGEMLLCYVIISEIVQVPEMKKGQVLNKPPFIPGKHPLRYDTTAKDKKSMNVIVKFENHTFYPAYVISFVKTLKSCTTQVDGSLSNLPRTHNQGAEKEVATPFSRISADVPRPISQSRPDPTPILRPLAKSRGARGRKQNSQAKVVRKPDPTPILSPLAKSRGAPGKKQNSQPTVVGRPDPTPTLNPPQKIIVPRPLSSASMRAMRGTPVLSRPTEEPVKPPRHVVQRPDPTPSLNPPARLPVKSGDTALVHPRPQKIIAPRPLPSALPQSSMRSTSVLHRHAQEPVEPVRPKNRSKFMHSLRNFFGRVCCCLGDKKI